MASLISEMFLLTFSLRLYVACSVSVLSMAGLMKKPATTMTMDSIEQTKKVCYGVKYCVKYAEHTDPKIPPIDSSIQDRP
jgi:hypothetical protein